MRRMLTCFFVASLITTGLIAQHYESPIKIGVLFGPSFNIEKSGSPVTDSSTLHSFAKNGFNAAITLSYRFPNSNFGIFGIGSWQRNPEDGQEFAKSGHPTDPDTAVVVHSNSLNTWKFLAGPDLHLPLGTDGKCDLEFSIGGGVLAAIAPDFTINSYYASGSEIEYFYGGRLPLTFCFQLSTAFNYHVNRFLSLVINASYTHSTPEYKMDYEYNYVPFHYTYIYPVRSLNLLAGVSCSL